MQTSRRRHLRYANEQSTHHFCLCNTNYKRTMTGVKLFRTYLKSKNLSADFENFSLEDLDTRLACFYIEMRNKEGQLCKKQTLISYSHGLQRHLEKNKARKH